MKFVKTLGIVLTAAALISLCACTSGQPTQTTQAGGTQLPGMAQTTAATLQVTDPSAMNVTSYDVHYDEGSGQMLYSISTFGEPGVEDGKLTQDDGKGASLVSTVGEIAEGTTGADLLEARIDRDRTILAEFGEEDFAFYESSDDGMNFCYFGLLTGEGKSIHFEMTFPTDARDTYFQHVSMLVQIYMDVYLEAEAAE